MIKKGPFIDLGNNKTGTSKNTVSSSCWRFTSENLFYLIVIENVVGLTLSHFKSFCATYSGKHFFYNNNLHSVLIEITEVIICK